MHPDVARLIEQGGRSRQEDAVRTASHPDGSWMLAVADGTGWGRRSADAAPAAVNALPPRIASEGEMSAAFIAANAAVRELTAAASHRPLEDDLPGIWDIEPQTTLAVVSWTPEGGLLAAWLGDSMVFLVPLHGGRGWHSDPHLMQQPILLTGMFAVLPNDNHASLRSRMRRLCDTMARQTTNELVSEGLIVAVLSDGAYTNYMSDNFGTWFSDDPDDNSIGFVIPPRKRSSAASIAKTIMQKASRRGLHDNTTVAVARVEPAVAEII